MGLGHMGIQIMAFDKVIRFYQKLGFAVTTQDSRERIVVLKSDSGIEINLLDSGRDDSN